jgi:glycosyltransferase involved in cell wall biosynthesis
VYTWLQHTDVDVPHLGNDDFTYMRGAFHTIDRPYPKLIDWLHHRIGSTHVAHHIDCTIPHYHARAATDAIAAAFPEVYLHDPGVAAEYRARTWFLRGCDRLLSISQATSDDLVELLGIPAERVVTVHGAAGARFVPTDPDLAAAADGFVLCPSGAEWRKNLDRLLLAWAAVPEPTRSAHPLVVQCHMDPATRAAWERRRDELGLSATVRFTGEVTDDELVRLMQTASLVVFPSLYEGLCLPVLEARRCGAPVVCGDNSSLRELVVDPDARFDATDVDAIAATLNRYLTDHTARRALAGEPVDQRGAEAFDQAQVAFSTVLAVHSL